MQIKIDYDTGKILFELPLTDENLLESHGLMMELKKKEAPAQPQEEVPSTT